MRFLRGGSGFSPTSKRSADCRMRCWPAFLSRFFRVLPLFLSSANNFVTFRYCFIRHTRSTLRDNRFCRCRWDTCPLSVSAAKTARFVRGFTVTRERYTVTLNHKCRHPRFYRHPPQTKVNRRFLNFGCRHGQQFLPTAGFRFYCHPTGRKSDPVFELRDSFEL